MLDFVIHIPENRALYRHYFQNYEIPKCNQKTIYESRWDKIQTAREVFRSFFHTLFHRLACEMYEQIRFKYFQIGPPYSLIHRTVFLIKHLVNLRKRGEKALSNGENTYSEVSQKGLTTCVAFSCTKNLMRKITTTRQGFLY